MPQKQFSTTTRTATTTTPHLGVIYKLSLKWQPQIVSCFFTLSSVHFYNGQLITLVISGPIPFHHSSIVTALPMGHVLHCCGGQSWRSPQDKENDQGCIETVVLLVSWKGLGPKAHSQEESFSPYYALENNTGLCTYHFCKIKTPNSPPPKKNKQTWNKINFLKPLHIGWLTWIGGGGGWHG